MEELVRRLKKEMEKIRVCAELMVELRLSEVRKRNEMKSAERGRRKGSASESKD